MAKRLKQERQQNDYPPAYPRPPACATYTKEFEAVGDDYYRLKTYNHPSNRPRASVQEVYAHDVQERGVIAELPGTNWM